MKQLFNKTSVKDLSVRSCVHIQNNLNVAQSGRSMVEMIGVLAIMAVLSIGGLTGYVYGMDKYRANETAQEISVRMFSAISQSDLSAASMSKLADE